MDQFNKKMKTKIVLKAQPGTGHVHHHTVNTEGEIHTLEVSNVLKSLRVVCLDCINRIAMKSPQKEFAGGVPGAQCVSTLYKRTRVPILLIQSH